MMKQFELANKKMDTLQSTARIFYQLAKEIKNDKK